jgi:hypothetical protein
MNALHELLKPCSLGQDVVKSSRAVESIKLKLRLTCAVG